MVADAAPGRCMQKPEEGQCAVVFPGAAAAGHGMMSWCSDPGTSLMPWRVLLEKWCLVAKQSLCHGARHCK